MLNIERNTLLAVTFPWTSARSIFAARVRMALVTIDTGVADFATTFVWLLTISMLLAAVRRANR